MSGDITKLPKWAQDHIQNLELGIKSRDRVIKEFQDNQEETQDYWKDLLSEAKHYLPDSAVIYFGDIGCKVRVSRREGKIRISSDQCLIIEPRAANTIEVYPGQH